MTRPTLFLLRPGHRDRPIIGLIEQPEADDPSPFDGVMQISGGQIALNKPARQQLIAMLRSIDDPDGSVSWRD